MKYNKDNWLKWQNWNKLFNWNRQIISFWRNRQVTLLRWKRRVRLRCENWSRRLDFDSHERYTRNDQLRGHISHTRNEIPGVYDAMCRHGMNIQIHEPSTRLVWCMWSQAIRRDASIALRYVVSARHNETKRWDHRIASRSSPRVGVYTPLAAKDNNLHFIQMQNELF